MPADVVASLTVIQPMPAGAGVAPQIAIQPMLVAAVAAGGALAPLTVIRPMVRVADVDQGLG